MATHTHTDTHTTTLNNNTRLPRFSQGEFFCFVLRLLSDVKPVQKPHAHTQELCQNVAGCGRPTAGRPYDKRLTGFFVDVKQHFNQRTSADISDSVSVANSPDSLSKPGMV